MKVSIDLCSCFVYFVCCEDSSADSDPLASAPPYVMHSLMQLGPRSEASNKVCRPFWWEVLSLMKSLPNDLTPDVVEVLANTGLKVCLCVQGFLAWGDLFVQVQ